MLDLCPITEQLRKAIDFAQQAGEIRRSETAKAIWHAVYSDLVGERGGLLGAVANRAAPQTMRLAMIYALLDRSSVIEVHHLTAALAVWSYCEASARYIFGDTLWDPTADQIERWLPLTRAYPSTPLMPRGLLLPMPGRLVHDQRLGHLTCPRGSRGCNRRDESVRWRSGSTMVAPADARSRASSAARRT